MRLVVGGPPNSGKSTVTAAIIQLLRERTRYRGVNPAVDWVSLDPVDRPSRG